MLNPTGMKSEVSGGGGGGTGGHESSINHEEEEELTGQVIAAGRDESVRVLDPELDYSPEDLKQAQTEILLRVNSVSRCTPALSVISTIQYTTSTVFVLCPQSMQYEDAIRKMLHLDARYIVETRPVTVDKVKEDAASKKTATTVGPLSDVMSVLPVTRTTLAIRRRAFKRLPRPPFLTFLYRIILTVLLAVIIACIYNVATG